MPHIEDSFFDVPEPEDIEPEQLIPDMPKTPKRPQAPPLQDRETDKKRGGGLFTRYSVKNWTVPADVDAQVSGIIDKEKN